MSKAKEELVAEIISLVEKLANMEDDPVQNDDSSIELLTLRECTQVVRGLSVTTVRQLIIQGKLRSIRTGQGKRGKILVNKADLLDYFLHNK